MQQRLLIIAFILTALNTKAQFSLTFCENITEDGTAVKPSNSFAVGRDGSLLKLLLKAPEGFNTEKLNFKIYFLNQTSAEQELTQLEQTVESGWNYVWKELVFFNPGSYRVKVYNSRGTYLTSANLNVKNL